MLLLTQPMSFLNPSSMDGERSTRMEQTYSGFLEPAFFTARPPEPRVKLSINLSSVELARPTSRYASKSSSTEMGERRRCSFLKTSSMLSAVEVDMGASGQVLNWECGRRRIYLL